MQGLTWYLCDDFFLYLTPGKKNIPRIFYLLSLLTENSNAYFYKRAAISYNVCIFKMSALQELVLCERIRYNYPLVYGRLAV